MAGWHLQVMGIGTAGRKARSVRNVELGLRSKVGDRERNENLPDHVGGWGA